MWAAGFSFGSYIAMTCGADDDRVCALIGIAPPVDRYDFEAVKRSTKPKFIIHGEADELIPLKPCASSTHSSGAEGVRRDRSRQPSVRRPGERGRRRPRGSAGGFLMQDAVIVSATRTAVGKAPNGTLRTVRPDDMAAAVIAEALRRAPGLEPTEIDDVILGCAMPEAEQGLNVARIASLRAGVPVDASAVTVNRFCSSGLQSIAFAAERIMCGFARRDRRRRHRVDEHGADGRQQGLAESDARGQLSGRVSEHRSGRRKPRARVRASPATSRTPLRCAATSGRSPPSTPDDSPTRSRR